jgi:prepilin-type N-terminal cleavage/methylation domain-containing protein
MKREEGFTLIELLMVVAIMGILASMAVMNLWRARSAANETSAIASLRNISSSQVAYSSICGGGRFATDLTVLGPQPTSSTGFLSPDLTSAVTVQKSGYNITLGASVSSVAGPNDCNGNPTQTGFVASAYPLTFGTSGNRSFATLSPTNVIYQIFDPLPPPEPFAAPAFPVQ